MLTYGAGGRLDPDSDRNPPLLPVLNPEPGPEPDPETDPEPDSEPGPPPEAVDTDG